MGNAIDKDGGECKSDTLARDITYKNYSSTEQLNIQPRKITKDNTATSNRQSAKRSNSRLRRTSFRGKTKSPGSIKRALSKDKKSGAILISDMEVQVDGKVCRLVPRQSVLKSKFKSSVKTKEAQNSLSHPKQKAAAKQKPQKRIISKPNSSSPVLLTRKPSYDTAVNQSDNHVKSTRDVKTPPSLSNIFGKVDFTKEDKSKNINNNNSRSPLNSPAESNKPEFSGIWRLNKQPNRDQSKRRSSGSDVYREISGQLNKLALVSPISDV